MADKQVAGELRAFGAAVERRFGEEGVRAMLRAGGRPGVVAAAFVAPEQRPALNLVAGMTAALKTGERPGAAAGQREAESERQGQRRDCVCRLGREPRYQWLHLESCRTGPLHSTIEPLVFQAGTNHSILVFG